MPVLIIDACAALHLKQLSHATHDAVGLLDVLGTLGVTFGSTKKVQQEHLDMSLSAQVDLWIQNRLYKPMSVRIQERKTALNTVGKLNPMPGRKDVDLAVLAEREGAVLLTHDGPAAVFASRLGVLTVDVVDLAALVVAQGAADWPEVNHRLGLLDTYAWKPDDWAGSVETTAASRVRWPRLLERLQRWLAQ